MALKNWNPGNIINDQVFYNADSFASVSDIQKFLDQKVAKPCNTWGDGPSDYNNGLSGKEHAAKMGWHGPPYSCLNHYHENPTTKENSFDNKGGWFEGGISVAQMLWDVSHKYQINPQVLLVILKKEQRSLFTDRWPLRSQYNSAMGYACPDTGPNNSANCNEKYKGFYNQLNMAGHQFRLYANYPEKYRYKASMNNYIQYNPNTKCGGNMVYIENQATASLYNYTPYQPNQASLDNYPGTAHCGAYGNRNFYKFFDEWFNSSEVIVSSIKANTNLAGVGQPISVSYSLTNPNSSPTTISSVGVSNRLKGEYFDFNIQSNVKLGANETKEFTGTFFPGKTGSYSMSVSYGLSGNWITGAPTVVQVKKPTITVEEKISHSPVSPLINNPHKISYVIKNSGDVEAHMTHLIAANIDNGIAHGYKSDNIVILKPGESYAYSDTRTPSTPGEQQSWISYMLPTGEWHKVGKTHDFIIYKNPAKTEISSPLKITPKNPLKNDSIDVEFKIKNLNDQPKQYKKVGIAVTRKSDNARFDFGSKPIKILGESEYTFKEKRSSLMAGEYTFAVTGTIDGEKWGTELVGEESNIDIKTSLVKVYNSPAKVEVTKPMVSRTVKQGESLSLSYTVKNSGDEPAKDVQIAYYCRFNNRSYCDIPGDKTTLLNNESHTVKRQVSFTAAGVYTLKPLRYQNNKWIDYGDAVHITVAPMSAVPSFFTTKLSFDKTSIKLGDKVTATFTIKNNSNTTVEIPRYAIAARMNGFHDFGFNNWFILNKNELKLFTATFIPKKKGAYALFPVILFNGTWMGYDEQKQSVIVE